MLGIDFSLDVIAIEAMAFVGGLAAVAAVYLIGSALRGSDTILSLVLTGVVVGSLLGACVGLVKYLRRPLQPTAGDYLLVARQPFGDRFPRPASARRSNCRRSSVLIALRWRMKLDEPVRGGGELWPGRPHPSGPGNGHCRCNACQAATVSVAGIIGWVGLVVPHLARFPVGPAFPRLLPTAIVSVVVTC